MVQSQLSGGLIMYYYITMYYLISAMGATLR